MQKEIVDAIITNSWKLLDESLQSITMQHEASSLMTDILRLAMQNDRLEMVEKLLGFQEVETVLKNRVLVFNWAAKNGYLNLVQRLLQSAEIRQCTEIQDNLALRLALENGHVAVVDTLLDVPAVRDSLDKHANWVMQLAIENHYELIIRRLLTFPAVKARLRSDRTWFLRLARNKYPELASELAAILEGQENPNLKLNNDNDLELVMQHNPREMGEETLEFEVLREEFRSDYDCNLLLAWAAAGGYLEVVRQLLQIPVIKAQAGAGSNFVLNCALLHKRFDVAKTLLEVSTVTNFAHMHNNRILQFMICSQQDAIVRQLLVLPNVKSNMSTRDHNLLAQHMCPTSGRSVFDYPLDYIYDLFLSKEEMAFLGEISDKILDYDSRCLFWAAKNGYLELVRELLRVPVIKKVYLNAQNDFALRFALENKHLEV